MEAPHGSLTIFEPVAISVNPYLNALIPIFFLKKFESNVQELNLHDDKAYKTSRLGSLSLLAVMDWRKMSGKETQLYICIYESRAILLLFDPNKTDCLLF